MIKLKPDPTFDYDVPLTVPGQAAPVVVPMTLAYMTAEQRVAWFESKKDGRVQDVLEGIVRGWQAAAVAGADGQPTPYSPQALAQLVSSYEAAPGEIISAWIKGLTESRVKN